MAKTVTGYAREICIMLNYDVVVYGGTPSGIITSICLAKKGKKVLLIEQSGHIGGMYAGGLMTAEIMHMQNGCISGLANDYYVRLGYETPEGFFKDFKHGDPAYFFECKTAEKIFVEWLHEYKNNVNLVYGCTIAGVGKSGSRIVSVTMTNGTEYTAYYFVDCSYDGDLMKCAGVSYTFGREPAGKYNEKYAGIRFQKDVYHGTTVDNNGKRLPFFREPDGLIEGDGDEVVNAYNYRCVLTQKKDNQAPFTRPQDYDSNLYYALGDYLQRNPLANLKDLFGVIKRGNGKTGFNTCQAGEKSVSVGLLGNQREYPEAPYSKKKSIQNFYKKYTKGLFYFLSTDTRVPKNLREEMASYGYAKDEFTENENFPYCFYVREALRLQGEYVFTEKDILDERVKDDAILLGSHWIDCHSVQKIALSDTTYINEGNIWVEIQEPYEIPYRIMLPKESECTNLLVPVCVSASHVGFCSVRLESTWMQLAHAAGTAISMAIDNGGTLHDLDVHSLQSSLREEGMVVKLQELKRQI